MKKSSKKEAEKYLDIFFSEIRNKTPGDVKKMLKIAMSHNIKLEEKRKLFCKKCFLVYNPKNTQVRIKKGMKIIRCLKCNSLMRWKIKN